MRPSSGSTLPEITALPGSKKPSPLIVTIEAIGEVLHLHESGVDLGLQEAGQARLRAAGRRRWRRRRRRDLRRFRIERGEHRERRLGIAAELEAQRREHRTEEQRDHGSHHPERQPSCRRATRCSTPCQRGDKAFS
jgi:hypothetical protein